jgi:hypothetical protein
MSEASDNEKVRATLDELKPWAEDEISHLERQFEARGKPVNLPYKAQYWVSFVAGLVCGLISAAMLFWLYPQIFNSA